MQNVNTFGVIQIVVLVLSVIIMGWRMNSSISKELKDEISSFEKRINSRFDKIDDRLNKIEQNHLEHIIQFHSFRHKSESD